ncbi:MAG: Cof-type HAD-IIB family hydrolase [Defluviitaleaceae bacterium]|nr:Cof-type HAD-IIB family hydrolase [Defluviitaleaceae bacterium]
MNKTFDKNNIKLAAFDVDGTIFHDGRISEAVQKALVKLSNSGIITVLATGRMQYGIPDSIRDLGIFRYGVLANGTLIWDFEKNCSISERPFERDEADSVLRVIDSLTDAYFAAFKSESSLTPKHLELLRRNIKLEVPKDGSAPKEIYPTYDNLLAHVANVDEQIFKLGCRFETAEACAEGRVKIREACNVEMPSTDGKDIEITPIGIHKGSGAIRLCEHLGLDISNVIAFGDSGNDVNLLEIAGFAVALDGGRESAKKAADYITSSVQEDGVAAAIEKLFGI